MNKESYQLANGVWSFTDTDARQRIKELEQENAELKRIIAESQKDVERYRYVREGIRLYGTKEEFDASIDAMLNASKEGV